MSHQAAKAHKNGGVTSENPSCVSQASSRSAFIQPFIRHAPFFKHGAYRRIIEYYTKNVWTKQFIL